MEIALAIFGGLVLLVIGAELLVRGSVRLAKRLGVSSLMIGLTVVGFGTPTPELVTSVQAALVGSPRIAAGNIVGSNIFNILAILGLAAIIQPLAVASTALNRDGVLVIAVSVLLTIIGFTWTLDRGTAVILLPFLVGYLVFAWRQERTAASAGHTAAFEKAKALEEVDAEVRPSAASSDKRNVFAWLQPLLFALGGLTLLACSVRASSSAVRSSSPDCLASARR